MNTFRSIISVIVGYLVFVVSAVLLYQIPHIDPHADPTTLFLIVSVLYGLVFSFAAGLLTQVVTKSVNLKMNYVLAAIMAGFAAISYALSPGNHYSQVVSVFLFAPCSIVGGWYFLRKKKGNRPLLP